MKNFVAAAIMVAALIGVVAFYWLSSGYGDVSPDAYQAAQALYGSCLAKSEQRLELVETMLDDSSEQPLELTSQERSWLRVMIAEAKAGDWQSAASDARQMMEEQVRY